jgi:hypothetical protein
VRSCRPDARARRAAQFQKIGALEEVAPTQMVDVIGVVDRVDASATIQRRDGSDVTKRNVYIRDDSGKGVEVTFWGAYCAAPGDQLEEARRPPARTELACTLSLRRTRPCAGSAMHTE